MLTEALNYIRFPVISRKVNPTTLAERSHHAGARCAPASKRGAAMTAILPCTCFLPVIYGRTPLVGTGDSPVRRSRQVPLTEDAASTKVIEFATIPSLAVASREEPS